MAKISDLVRDFLERERPAGTVLADETVTAQAIAAVRFYAGYAFLHAFKPEIGSDYAEEDHANLSHIRNITPETDISTSEWAIIRPLFILYIERENAIHLEASRVLGVEPYGRSTSEVAGEISQYEAQLSKLAFCEPIITMI